VSGRTERASVKPEALHYLETLLVGVIGAALAAQNALVALESAGLGSVHIGAIRNAPEPVAKELALPQSVVLHREQYDAPAQTQGIALYNDILAGFLVRQGPSDARWTDRSIERWRTRKSLQGRNRLREALNALGFELR
jgi:hypothetical protein